MKHNATGLIRVAVVHEYQLLCDAIRCLLEIDANIEVVGAVHHSEEAANLSRSTQIDVIILNVPNSGDSILESIPSLTEEAQPKVLVFTQPGDDETTRLAIRLGASGVVRWDEPGDVLIKAVRRVRAGELWLNRSLTAKLFEELRNGPSAVSNSESSPLYTLSPREQEIVAFVGQGLTTRKIAEQLYISEKTVRNHLTSIYAKLGISDRVELVLFAIRNGLASAASAADCNVSS